MDQIKIGEFLKILRTEKNITQIQLAEKFGVSNRTVSRWECGTNMPDLSILVELAKFYGVEVGEILNGERNSIKNEAVANDGASEASETIGKVVEYTNKEKKQLKKRFNIKMTVLSTAVAVVLVAAIILGVTIGYARLKYDVMLVDGTFMVPYVFNEGTSDIEREVYYSPEDATELTVPINVGKKEMNLPLKATYVYKNGCVEKIYGFKHGLTEFKLKDDGRYFMLYASMPDERPIIEEYPEQELTAANLWSFANDCLFEYVDEEDITHFNFKTETELVLKGYTDRFSSTVDGFYRKGDKYIGENGEYEVVYVLNYILTYGNTHNNIKTDAGAEIICDKHGNINSMEVNLSEVDWSRIRFNRKKVEKAIESFITDNLSDQYTFVSYNIVDERFSNYGDDICYIIEVDIYTSTEGKEYILGGIEIAVF